MLTSTNKSAKPKYRYQRKSYYSKSKRTKITNKKSSDWRNKEIISNHKETDSLKKILDCPKVSKYYKLIWVKLGENLTILRAKWECSWHNWMPWMAKWPKSLWRLNRKRNQLILWNKNWPPKLVNWNIKINSSWVLLRVWSNSINNKGKDSLSNWIVNQRYNQKDKNHLSLLIAIAISKKSNNSNFNWPVSTCNTKSSI